jgi:hypothetical protein
MGHPQDATELKTDNTTADGIANKTVLQKYPRLWTCAIIGSKTASSKENSTSAGPPVTQTWVTTLQSTTPRPITSESTRSISTATLSQWYAITQSTLCCEGVLIFALSPRLPTYPYPVWAPIHAIVQGYLCRWLYLHYCPPHSSTGQSYTCNMAISKSRNTATPHYSALRVSAMLDGQLQKTVTSYCSAVRTHAMSDGHTLTPHYSSGRTRTPSGSLMYHRLFPRSDLSYYNCNTH